MRHGNFVQALGWLLLCIIIRVYLDPV
jgi:hypothetical protein